MASLALRRFASAEAFLARAEEFLTAREAEHNLLLGIAGTLRDHPDTYPEPPYLATVEQDGAVGLAALRTPPWNLVLSETPAPAMVGVVVDDLARTAADLPGVQGSTKVAHDFATAWSRRLDRAATLDMRERIFRLIRVLPPPAPPSGGWRYAAESDAALIHDWIVAFREEAVPHEPALQNLDALVERWIGRVGRTIYLWNVDDRVVSLVAAGSPTPHGIRIGPVYTPPAERGRGYASALTAAASQDQLDAGRTFCFLFTDLANPTSNHIYQAIGYEPVADFDMYRFTAAEP